MKWICYIFALIALLHGLWNILLLQNDYATISILSSIACLQLAIFWKKPRMQFTVRTKRKEIFIHIPKFILSRTDEKHI